MDFTGDWSPWFEMPLERGSVIAFAAATGSTRPPALTSANPIIPPTFLTTAAHTWGYSLEKPDDGFFQSLAIDRAILLHAEEEYEYVGSPPRAGITLSGRSRLANVFRKTGARGGSLLFYVVETEFNDGSGRLVARQRTTVVHVETPADTMRPS